MNRHRHLPLTERGVVLVTSLLLLIVVTIMALSMFRSFGMQEKAAGTTREKQRALQAAESAQQYAEWWLYNTNAVSLPVTCNSLSDAANGTPQICINPLNNVSAVPWKNGANDIGATYQPPQMAIGNASITNWNNYAVVPRFYIADLGLSTDPNIPGEIYQVDAVGYGGSADTVAVVESTFAVYSSSRNTTL